MGLFGSDFTRTDRAVLYEILRISRVTAAQVDVLVHQARAASLGGRLEAPVLKDPTKERKTMLVKGVVDTLHKIRAVLEPVKIDGSPATVEGKPDWTIQNSPDGAELDVAADGLSAFLIPGVATGTAEFTAVGDADLGEGVNPISQTFVVTVIDAQASSLGGRLEEPVIK